MHSLIAWAGFLGAWLLVAGPIYQAAVELREQDLEEDQFAHVRDEMEQLPRVSPWWWLLPPARYWVGRRRRKRYMAAALAAMTVEQRDVLATFKNKAVGWMFVGLGGALIATKETWELVEHHEWPHWLFWVLTFGMLWLCLLNTVWQMANSRQFVAGEFSASRSERRGRRRPA